ncbi:hypothetical protein H0H81_005501 [Sphagnurus paluster]|uniref:Ubiquitin-like protease family profile domain-containing protein n=1 Tax=Sphagnurus paluster TaxID=117069 RepID=A0A9P7GTL0_9AGAR|nr:hypothetical protein H0H81_005501 [Sphagnurus paluster]
MRTNMPPNPRTPVASSSAPEVIELHDDEEDIGTLIDSTPDTLDLFKHDSISANSLRERQPSVLPFRIAPQPIDVDDLEITTTQDLLYSHHTPSAASGSKRRLVTDGDETKRLQKELAPHEELESDPIEEFSPDPVHQPMTRVRSMAQLYENKVIHKKPPFIDLKTVPQSKNMKGGMKKKNPPKRPKTHQQDELSMPTPFTSSKIKQSGMKKQQLRLKNWFIGTSRMPERAASEYTLKWSDEKLIITEEGKRANHFELAIRSEVARAEYSHDAPELVLVLHTLPPINAKGKTRNSERFKMGDEHCGVVTVQFDDENEDLKVEYGKTFIPWLKTKMDTLDTLRGAASHSALELAMIQSLSGDASANRGPSKRPAPPDNDSTPPVAESSTALEPSSRPLPQGVPIVPRRSARRPAPPPRQRSPSLDPDEVILCYPQGVPGAVNLTNADLKRLQPGEFLNDTLIEFGLKLWLKKLHDSNPELANEVHVFSSFFYKKLNKRIFDEGYDSVRKWTAKLDLFSKKYIIIPINEHLHWYLAIIYQPEYILIPPPVVASPATRGRKSIPISNNQVASVKPISATAGLPSYAPFNEALPPLAKPSSSDPPSVQESALRDASMSESEAEEVFQVLGGRGDGRLGDFNVSSSTTPLSEDSDPPSFMRPVSRELPQDASSPLTDMDTEDHGGMTNQRAYSYFDTNSPAEASTSLRAMSPTVSDYERSKVETQSPIDIDMDDATVASRSHQGDTWSLFDGEDNEPSISASVEPQSFYGNISDKARGKQKAIPNQAVLQKNDFVYSTLPFATEGSDPGAEINEEEEPAVSSSAPETTTYIFTFDSLGSKHPQAIRQLRKYLKKEAEDKLGKTNTSEAQGKQAQVPVQPNFCDCGLYLLHFAETFMSDPSKYSKLISTRSPGKVMNAARQDDWNAARTVNMRERLAEEIKELSALWKQNRAAREEAKRQELSEGNVIEVVESSDDEVDIVETIPVVPVAHKGKRDKQSRSIGKAVRMRG